MYKTFNKISNESNLNLFPTNFEENYNQSRKYFDNYPPPVYNHQNFDHHPSEYIIRQQPEPQSIPPPTIPSFNERLVHHYNEHHNPNNSSRANTDDIIKISKWIIFGAASIPIVLILILICVIILIFKVGNNKY